MMRTSRWPLLSPASLPTCLSLACALIVAGSHARAELVFGLTTSNGLVSFDSATPGAASASVPITGIGAETILDIDRRPANGLLYGLSSAGKIYSINTTTGLATQNAALVGVSLDAAATRFGIDFNPTVDRLRIVSNTGQNLRVTPDTSVTTIDGVLKGAATGAVSVAYTNNDNDPATGTVLFYIGPSTPTTTFNTSDPNDGVLALVGAMGVGSSQDVGFDISGLTGVAFASLASPTGGGSSLYTINLTSGAASLVGSIGVGLTLRGIAVATAIPEPASIVLLGIGLAGAIIGARRTPIVTPLTHSFGPARRHGAGPGRRMPDLLGSEWAGLESLRSCLIRQFIVVPMTLWAGWEARRNSGHGREPAGIRAALIPKAGRHAAGRTTELRAKDTR
jgi:hypothetical protein